MQEQVQRQAKVKAWKPHKKQEKIRFSEKSIRFFIGGNRTGKTEWGAKEAKDFSFGTHPKRLVNVPNEGWICSPSYEVQIDTTQKKLMRFISNDDIADSSYARKGALSRLVLKNGSLITFKTYEQGAAKFQGAEKRWIWFDEEPPHDIWEECFVRREAGMPLDVWVTMTPINGMTWVYDDIYLNTDNPDLATIVAEWKDNPHLTEQQKEEMRRGLSDEILEVREKGKFVKRVGLVCPWWRRDVHLIDITERKSEWNIFLNGDFGFAVPSVILLIGVDHEDNWWIYDGIYQAGLTNPKLIDLIRTKTSGVMVTGGWGDSEDPRTITELQEAGIPIVAVEKVSGDTKESWDEFRAKKLAEHGQIMEATNKPKIFVSKSLVRYDEKKGKKVNWFVQEIENLRWKEVRTTDGMKQQPRWGDQPKHAIDTLSYFAVSYKKPVDVTKLKFPEEKLFSKEGFY